MHAFVRSPLCLFRVNQSINHITSITSTIVRARAETPSQRVPSHSMSAARWPRVYPLCVHACTPLHACTPGTHIPLPPPPLDGPAPVDRDTSTGHARGLISHPPPSPHKKRKTKTKSPPLPLQKCTNKHTTGAVVVVFNPPEGPSDHTRAPACAMDNERCHVSETCGSCVPSTRTGHDSRKTTHAHRPRASHRHRRRRCRVVARIARRQCATRACVRFARRPRTRSSARYPSPPSPRRPSRERDVARARDADENPARRTDATDRRRRPTTNDDDEDESIRTQGRRYGTRGRVSTRAR